jgi:hypothetical protein
MDTHAEPIASFVAVIPDISTAFKISGQGDGRLTLDVPESELPEVLKLMAFGREKCLRVDVSAEN